MELLVAQFLSQVAMEFKFISLAVPPVWAAILPSFQFLGWVVGYH
jgi:hypothetical protein